MEVGIIGAGFTGLGAAYYLSKEGYKVSVFESEKNPGGLASGFKLKNWKWSLENHYHHLFLTDAAIKKLAEEINYKIIVQRPKTSSYFGGHIDQIDSPLGLLKYGHISLISRIRTGIVLALLKIVPFNRAMEEITAEKFIKQSMGRSSWDVLWGPLLKKKFGKYSREIPFSWFWARIKSRTARLAYPKGGFLSFAKAIARKIVSRGGSIYFYEKISSIRRNKQRNLIEVATESGKSFWFDKLIFTLPIASFAKIVNGFPKRKYLEKHKLIGLGAINLVMVLNQRLFKDKTYWLNINEESYPFLCMVEHTNFINKRSYNNQHLVYIGNYLDIGHKYFSMNAPKIFEDYLPYIKRIVPSIRKTDIKKLFVFKTKFAQPIITLNYSRRLPTLETPIEGIYIANIQQVYPWDRGVNYAVALGRRVAKKITEDLKNG
jgi:protoporphyrinogen oxidase